MAMLGSTSESAEFSEWSGSFSTKKSSRGGSCFFAVLLVFLRGVPKKCGEVAGWFVVIDVVRLERSMSFRWWLKVRQIFRIIFRPPTGQPAEGGCYTWPFES
jgi:hypothetical protein